MDNYYSYVYGNYSIAESDYATVCQITDITYST